jgi:hypothetical protein
MFRAFARISSFAGCLGAVAGFGADFSVVNSGFTAYVINGTNNPNLTLVRGRTYTFDILAIGHPFWIKTNRVTGATSAYTNGVAGNGTASGTLTFAVPTNAPGSLFYSCQIHAAMSGFLVITNPPPPPPSAVLTNLTRLANGNLQFTVAGNAGATYQVLASTNVASTNWVAVATNTPAGGSFNFVVSNTAALPQQHFRVVQ